MTGGFEALHFKNVLKKLSVLMARFAGANICVIKIQLPVVPYLRGFKRSAIKIARQRRRHFRESSQQFQ